MGSPSLMMERGWSWRARRPWMVFWTASGSSMVILDFTWFKFGVEYFVLMW